MSTHPEAPENNPDFMDNGHQDDFDLSFNEVQREIARRWQQGQKLAGLEQRGSVAGERWEAENLDELYVSAEKAREVLRRAWDRYGKEELARSLGEEVARLAYECYGKAGGVFAVIGRGWKGRVAVHAVRALAEKGWTTAAWAEEWEKNDGKAILSQAGVELCEFVPQTLEMFYNVILEGLFGLGWDGAPVRDEFWAAHHMICNTRSPIVSIGVPAGWDADGGPRMIDMEMDEFIKPEMLVSFGVPTIGTKKLGYGYHYVAGQFVDREWAKQNNVKLPKFANDGAASTLIKRDPIKFGFEPGEIYGKPGKYIGTLFNKNPRRKWVGDIDEIEWITAVE